MAGWTETVSKSAYELLHFLEGVSGLEVFLAEHDAKEVLKETAYERIERTRIGVTFRGSELAVNRDLLLVYRGGYFGVSLETFSVPHCEGLEKYISSFQMLSSDPRRHRTQVGWMISGPVYANVVGRLWVFQTDQADTSKNPYVWTRQEGRTDNEGDILLSPLMQSVYGFVRGDLID
jgi:hypothetical protein